MAVCPSGSNCFSSLRIVGSVALTVFFLRLGIPGPAFAFLVVGFLLLAAIERP